MFYQNVLEMTRSQIQRHRYEEFCILCHVGQEKMKCAATVVLCCYVFLLCFAVMF